MRRGTYAQYFFLIVFTLLLSGYGAVIFLFPQSVLQDLHHRVLWMDIISTFLWIGDRNDEIFVSSSQSTYPTFGFWKSVVGTTDQYRYVESETWKRFFVSWLPASWKLYAPVFVFQWWVSSGAQSIRLSFTHEGRHIAKDILVDEEFWWEDTFSISVWLHSNSLYAWKNDYLLEVVYDSGEVLSKQISLSVEYDRLFVGAKTLFLDTHMIPEGMEEDIVRTAKDLEWNDTYYITYWCDPYDPKPPLLLKDVVEYKVVPACLSFSLAKGYVLLFSFQEKVGQERMYSVDRGSLGNVWDAIPLYHQYFWQIFYSLVFYDPLTDQLSLLRTRWDKQKNDLQLLVRHIPTHSIDLQIDVFGGTQIQIVTRTEKIIFYLYKERDNKTALIHPGTRFQYFRKSAGDRRNKVEEGQAYSLPVRVIAPWTLTKPTYSFGFFTDGSDIVITDGVRRLDLKKNSLRTSLRTTQLNSQYVDCDRVVFGAFGNLFGDQYTSYSVRNPVFLLASWLPETNVTLSYNDEVDQVTPDQLFAGYLYHSLRYPNKWLHRWVNTYTLHIKNARNNDICTKQISILVD